MTGNRALPPLVPLLFAAVLLSGCGGGGGGGASGTACDLLTAEEVGDAVGNEIVKVESSDTKRACSYGPADILHEVRVFMQKSPADLCDLATESLVDVDEPVEGLGERAAIGVEGSGIDEVDVDIVACTSDVVVNMTLDGGDDETELREASIELVRLALERATAD